MGYCARYVNFSEPMDHVRGSNNIFDKNQHDPMCLQSTHMNMKLNRLDIVMSIQFSGLMIFDYMEQQAHQPLNISLQHLMTSSHELLHTSQLKQKEYK